MREPAVEQAALQADRAVFGNEPVAAEPPSLIEPSLGPADFPVIASPLRDVGAGDLDRLIIRENSDGEHAGQGGRTHPGASSAYNPS